MLCCFLKRALTSRPFFRKYLITVITLKMDTGFVSESVTELRIPYLGNEYLRISQLASVTIAK